jgi:GAF domain-containing protein
MEQANGALALFFVFALILVLKSKKHIWGDSTEAYTNISGGLAILAVATLTRVYHDLGMFGRVPFLSEDMFFEIAAWIGTITGAAFLVSGVSNWLPLARQNRRYNKQRIVRLELLRKVEQLVGVETRLDTILSTTLQYMVEHFSFAYGAVCKYSNRHHRLSFTSATDTFPGDGRELERLRLDKGRLDMLAEGALDNPSALFAERPRRLKRPTCVLPIIVGSRPAGFFLLWSEGRAEYDSDDNQTLRLAVDVIARKVENDRVRLEHEATERRRTWEMDMRLALDGTRTLRENLSAVMKIAPMGMPVHYSSLTVLNPGHRTARRFAVGPTGQMLEETGLAVPDLGMLTGPAYQAQHRIIRNDLIAETQPAPRDLVVGDEVGSLAAIPIVRKGVVAAVLTVAARQREAYVDGNLQRLEILVETVGAALDADKTSQMETTVSNRLTRLNEFAATLLKLQSPDEVFRETAQLVARETQADMVRISTLEDNGAFLKSQALVSTGAMTEVVPPQGAMIVSLMPVHEQVLTQRKRLSAGAGAGRRPLVTIEAKQAFAEGVMSLVVQPAMSGGQMMAVISIGSMRPDFDPDADIATRSFLESVATMLALVLERRREEAMVEPMAAVDRIISGVPATASRLKSPIFDSLSEVEPAASNPDMITKRQLEGYLTNLDRASRMAEQPVEREVVPVR